MKRPLKFRTGNEILSSLFAVTPRILQRKILITMLRIFWWLKRSLVSMSITHFGLNPKHFSSWGTLPFLRRWIRSHHHVLDLGCGLGELTFALAGFVKTVVAMDVDSSAICEAKRRNLRDNIEYVCADVDAVSFTVPSGNESYDFAILSSTLSFSKNPKKLLTELRAVSNQLFIRETRRDENHIALISSDLGVRKHDYNEFTSDELKTIVADSGWIVEEEWQTFDIFLVCSHNDETGVGAYLSY